MSFVKSLWICFIRVLESRRDGFNINWLYYYYLFLQSNAFSHTSSANVMGLDLYLLSWSLSSISALDTNSTENTIYAVIGWHVCYWIPCLLVWYVTRAKQTMFKGSLLHSRANMTYLKPFWGWTWSHRHWEFSGIYDKESKKEWIFIITIHSLHEI